MAANKPSFLRRYTDLPALLYMLREQKITLLDPESWDDRNDTHYLSSYKDKKNLQTVLALCFSMAGETYHHWSVFSKGPAGVCVVFKQDQLKAELLKQIGVTAKEVHYFTINNARKRIFKTEELPFVKRVAFKPEEEFRFVYESADKNASSINIPFDLSCIERISLSPWLHKNLSSTTIQVIRAVDGCAKLKVSRSTLISNEKWKNLSEKAI